MNTFYIQDVDAIKDAECVANSTQKFKKLNQKYLVRERENKFLKYYEILYSKLEKQKYYIVT